MDIKRFADSIVRKHQSRDPFEIVRGLNVILLFVPLTDTRAFFQYFQRNNIIYIDENLSSHEKAFECAHELGHMFLHKKSNFIFMDTRTGFNTNKYEIEADTFAMDLLVEDVKLLEYHSYTAEQVSHILGYEKRLIDLRLKDFDGR
ncbi:MAG: ImmA/IrrE family metallo-endopeptidase [Roseburia sp.]|nr:ImmA/IrrE family metallo-endopeptidase [Roseburia sp.]